LFVVSVTLSLLCAPDCLRVLREDIGRPLAGRGVPLQAVVQAQRQRALEHEFEALLARRDSTTTATPAAQPGEPPE
jgi:hypothetical protein